MGDLIKISCRSCGWQKHGSTGKGMFSLLSLSDGINELPLRMQNKIRLFFAESSNLSGLIIFERFMVHCDNCNEIGFRQKVTINAFKGEKKFNLENNFNCGGCRRRVFPIKESSLLNLCCPNCNSKEIGADSWGIWD